MTSSSGAASRGASPSPRRRFGWLLVIAFACGASFPYLSRLMNANERPRLLQAVAIIDHGTWAIDPIVARGIAPGPDISRAPGMDAAAATVPNKPPGGTIPALVAYASLRGLAAVHGEPPQLATLTLLARMLGALLPTIVLAWFAARRLGDDATARAAVTIVVLATPLASYAHVLFGHSLAALCLFVGATWVQDAMQPDSTWRRGAAGGFVAALAVTVEYGAAFVALPLGVAVLRGWLAGARVQAVAALTGALVPIAALAAYHHAVYGSAFTTGYHAVIDPGFAEIHGRGLLGLTWPRAGDVLEDLISPHGGLLYWAPVVAFVHLGLRGDSRDAAFARAHAWIFAAMLLLTLGLEQSGGWRVGPRYLVAGLPALAPALALALRTIGRREVAAALFAGVALWSVVMNALAANWFPHLVPTGNPLRDQLVPLLRMELDPYSVLDGFSGRIPHAVWVPVVAAVLAVVHAVHTIVEPQLRRRVWVAAAIVVGAIAAAAWSVPPAEDAETSLAGIAEIWEPAGPHAPRRVPLRD